MDEHVSCRLERRNVVKRRRITTQFFDLEFVVLLVSGDGV